jgi:hypothetical protein
MTDDLVKRLLDVASPLADEAAGTIHRLTADNARLRALLSEADARIAWESIGFGTDFAERVEAALT